MIGSEAQTPPPPATSAAARRRTLAAGVGGLAGLLVIVLVVALAFNGGGPAPPATGAARLVPSDALAYVNLSLDRGRPGVRQALALARRLPDFPLAAAAVESRLAAILGGGRGTDPGQVTAWLGNEAALALLNTPTSTAGSLIVLDVRDRARALAFVRGAGAGARGRYRGTALYTYPTGSELAFISHYLVLGQDASVRAAIDVNAGAGPSLAGSPVYERATAPLPAGRVLDAYASLAGVRRVLAAQGGVIGAIGGLLYQPALQGVALSLSPAAGGARLRIHSALDSGLQKLSPPVTSRFEPTLQHVMPSGSILMIDVAGLDRVAPSVLGAGAVAGVGGGIGPLLSRLGSALAAEGVNIRALEAIFHPETAVALVPNGASPALVVVARTRQPAQTRTELASLEVPLAQLFTAPSSGPGKVPVFNDRSVGGITEHQLSLANGLELDYSVFGGLVVISTSPAGVAAVAQRSHTLATDPGYRFALAGRPSQVTALVYSDFARLLSLGFTSGLTASPRLRAAAGDLARITAIGLTSTRGPGFSDSQLSVRIP